MYHWFLLTILPGCALADLLYAPNETLTPRQPPLLTDQWRHSFSAGLGKSSDVLLFSTTVEKMGIPFLKRSEVVHCPRQNMPGKVKRLNATIGVIYAVDRFFDGRGGYMSLTKGGIGHNFAELQVTSQRGKPYCFFVRIYGQYNASNPHRPLGQDEVIVNVPYHYRFYEHDEFPTDYDYIESIYN